MLDVLWRLTRADLSEGGERWLPSAGSTELSIVMVEEENGEAGKRLTEAGEAAGWRLTGVEAVPETRRPTVGFKPRVSRKTDGDDVGLTERCLMHSGWIVCR